MRTLKGYFAVIASAIAVSASIFHLYVAKFGMLEALKQRSVHMTFLLPLAFLMYPARKNSSLSERFSILDALLALLSILSGLYVAVFDYERIVSRAPYMDPVTNLDIAFGIIAVLLFIEATRRVIGRPLAIVAVIFLVYGFTGKYLPGILWHRGFSLSRIIDHLYLTTEGIFGIPLGASATFVFLFVLFGVFLEKTGAAGFFIQLALALTGHARGGPAKAGVIASALMGTVSGSVVANVVTTGTFTIPLMKKIGYSSRVAGAVESVASTGGQLMPPVMGAAAFIMAQLMGVSYISICLTAAIPAVLYYVALFIGVHFEAVSAGLKGLPREQLPKLKRQLKEGGTFLIPLAGIVVLLVGGYSPYLAGFWGIVLVVIVGIFQTKEKRITFKKILEALDLGAKAGILVAIACGTAGIVVGIASLTGLALRFTSIVLSASCGIKFLGLIMTMVACLLLGMGIPTTPAYIVVAALGVPALMELGIPKIGAHMFVFYFACISSITPPVAIAAYAGAGLSKADPMGTATTAVKLGLVGFIVPFMFAYGPALLFQGTTVQVLTATATAIIGVALFASATAGWLIVKMTIPERLFTLLGGLLMMTHGFLTDVIGLGIAGAVFLFQFKNHKSISVSNAHV